MCDAGLTYRSCCASAAVSLKASPQPKPKSVSLSRVLPWVCPMQDYQHLYYGGLSSTMLCPPAGEEALLEVS